MPPTLPARRLTISRAMPRPRLGYAVCWSDGWIAGPRGDQDVVGAQAAACTIARDVAARLVAAGAVNDAAYAENRARSLIRAGQRRGASRTATAPDEAEALVIQLRR